MISLAPICRTVSIFAFHGDRSRHFVRAFQSALDFEKKSGPGPSRLDCLLFNGHAGVSLDQGTTIYGFNPDSSGVSIWQLMDNLRIGKAFPAVVRDDSAVFSEARRRALVVVTFDVILPEPRFQDFESTLDAERQKSQYTYGFPDGDGECNCLTWLERLGLPLLTGRMKDFSDLSWLSGNAPRRFGRCV